MSEKQLTAESIIKTSSGLVESNRKLATRIQDRGITQMLESTKAAFGIDMKESAKHFQDPFFSIKAFREGVYKRARGTFHEANAENALQQLLRAGINMICNQWYELVETNHEAAFLTTYSDKAIELYAPLHRAGTPRRVPKGGQFPRVRVQGLDIQVANEKFGAIFDVERELMDFDQTGQIVQRAKDAGEQMRVIEDAWAFQRFIGSAGSYGGDTIPASVTYSTVWTPSTSPFSGGGFNAPASYGAFTPANVQAGDIALMGQLDLQGNFLLVNPNTLLVGRSNKFSARELLNSEWYPSTATIKVGGGAGADSTLGTSFARNVMQGLYNLIVSRFLPTKSWSIGESGKGFIFQRASALEVVQENPASGLPFTHDIFAWRSRAMWEPDWIDPRFWWLGNDGTV
jgi:hypothetical protein